MGRVRGLFYTARFSHEQAFVRYPLEQCTWQTEKDMAEPMKLIEAFTEAAEKEDKDLGNPYKRILLREVEKSGWIDPDK